MKRTSRIGSSRHSKGKMYYAHALCLYDHMARMYGWTVEERIAIQKIRRRFPDYRLVNPARYGDHPKKRADQLGFCFGLIDGCDLVIFSRLRGKITSGVGKEINYALKIGRPVFELLLSGRCVKIHSPQKYLSRQGTLSLYNRWRNLQKMPRWWSEP